MHCSLYLRAVAWPWLRMRQHQLGEWRKEVVKSCSFLYINFFYFYYLFLSRCRLWCIINVAVNVSNNGQKGKPFSDMQFFLCACRMKGKWVSGAAYRYGKTNCLWWIVEKQYFFLFSFWLCVRTAHLTAHLCKIALKWQWFVALRCLNLVVGILRFLK